jgi:hypothetical protein
MGLIQLVVVLLGGVLLWIIEPALFVSGSSSRLSAVIRSRGPLALPIFVGDIPLPRLR